MLTLGYLIASLLHPSLPPQWAVLRFSKNEPFNVPESQFSCSKGFWGYGLLFGNLELSATEIHQAHPPPHVYVLGLVVLPGTTNPGNTPDTLGVEITFLWKADRVLLCHWGVFPQDEEDDLLTWWHQQAVSFTQHRPIGRNTGVVMHVCTLGGGVRQHPPLPPLRQPRVINGGTNDTG